MFEMRKMVFKAHIITYIVLVKILCSSGHNYKLDESAIASTSISSNTNNNVQTKREFSGRAKIPTTEEMNQWFGPTDEVKKGWVDPHVMFDYDRNAINHDRINNIKRYTDETQFQDEDLQKNDKGDVKSNENPGEIKNNTELYNCHDLQNDLNNCKKSLFENTQGFCKCEYIYLKRLVKKLLNKFKPFDFKLKNNREIQINVRLSSSYIEAFNLFVEYPDKYIYELDQNLSELISSSTLSEQHVIKESWLEFLYRVIWLSELTIPVLCFFGLVLLKVHFMNKSWFQLIVGSLAIIFVVSFCVDWIYLYKVQLAKKHASLSHGSVPQECSTSDMTWWQSLKAWFKSGLTVEENPCEKYYKSILVDPFWEVTPLMALSESITKFVLHPAGLLGTHIGRFTRLLYSEIPSFLWLPVTVFIFIIVCLIFVMFFGYRIHFPFFLGTLEPVHRNTEALNLSAKLLSKVSMETLTPNDPSAPIIEVEEIARSNSMENNIKDCIKGKNSESRKVSKKWSVMDTRKTCHAVSVPYNMLDTKSGTSKNINKQKLIAKSLSDSNLVEMNNEFAVAAKNYSCILKSIDTPSNSDEGFSSEPHVKKNVLTKKIFSAGDVENER